MFLRRTIMQNYNHNKNEDTTSESEISDIKSNNKYTKMTIMVTLHIKIN